MKKTLLIFSALLFSNIYFSQYWTTKFSGFTTESRGILGMEMYDANIAWAFAYDGANTANNVQEFTKTSNGGLTWTAGTINVGNPALKITNISGVSATTAWVATFDPQTGIGGAWKTSDGGATWTEQQQLTTNGESWCNFVHFFDANTGVLMGDPEASYFEIYRSTDGGSSWTRIPNTSLPLPLSGEYGYNGGYYSVGDNIFFYTNKGRIIKSTDKGLTWSVALTTGTITDFGSAAVNGDMAWADANNGIVVRKTFSGTTPTGMTIHRTTNGGSTWSSLAYTGISATNRISDITFVPGTNVLVATSGDATNGGSWKSMDGGTTWTALDTAVQHLSVRCSDLANCLSGGFSSSLTASGMFKSQQNLSVSDIALLKNAVVVYPNPVTTSFQLKTKGFETSKTQITVTDISGKKIKTFAIQDHYDISNFEKGTYLITISDGITTETKKIIKQ